MLGSGSKSPPAVKDIKDIKSNYESLFSQKNTVEKKKSLAKSPGRDDVQTTKGRKPKPPKKIQL